MLPSNIGTTYTTLAECYMKYGISHSNMAESTEKLNIRLEIEKLDSELDLTREQIEELFKRQESLVARKESLERQLKQEHVSSKDWATKSFKWSSDCEQLRKTVFNIDKFRPLQLECINVTMSGIDCLLIMPTGGGKSLCFQLPSLLSACFTLVISPLISLMEDQLMSLKEYNIRAGLLNASSDKEHVNVVHKEMICKDTKLKVLYVTPEKIAKSKRFMAKLEKAYEGGNLARIVIDEVHCTSQWGNDFRPDYKILGILKRQFPNVPILGLTATATAHVIEDIKKILNLNADCVLLKSSFNRVNLFYEVRKKPSTDSAVLDEIADVIKKQFSNQSGIVYCFSRKDSVAVSSGLSERNVSTAYYHADLAAETRTQVHRAWTKGDLKVIVATVAFGMGIDKPNVRFVIHHAISKSMENYYQESGRAGRDNLPAHCILYYSASDATRQSCMVFTEQTGLENLYKMLSYCQNITSCRRSLIGQHFGEHWDDNSCNNMCDNCKELNAQSNGGRRTTDVSKQAQDVLNILKNAQEISERVTMIKLLDAWQGRGAKALRLSSVSRPSLTTENCQRLIIKLLLEGAIREDFHFTPYTTISYLVLGHRAVNILENKKQVDLALLNSNITESDNQPRKRRSKSTVISQQSKKQKCQELKISVVISDDET